MPSSWQKHIQYDNMIYNECDIIYWPLSILDWPYQVGLLLNKVNKIALKFKMRENLLYLNWNWITDMDLIPELFQEISKVCFPDYVSQQGKRISDYHINQAYLQCFSTRLLKAIFSPISVHTGFVNPILAKSTFTASTRPPVDSEPMFTIKISFLLSFWTYKNYFLMLRWSQNNKVHMYRT